MSRLTWDQPVERLYQAGVDHVVLYLINEYEPVQPAGRWDSDGDINTVVWNGVTSIEETSDDQEQNTSIYFDGEKLIDLQSTGTYSATLKAFTYPDEFLACEGVKVVDGAYFDNQIPKTFSLSYRTIVADEVSGTIGYQIHIVYNLTATAEDKVYTTISANASPMEFSWKLSAIPEDALTYNPTAHIIFDTRYLDPVFLQELEEMLYGSDEVDALLPTLEELLVFSQLWAYIRVTDNGDGTWTAEENPAFEGQYITMLNGTTFQIDTPSAEFTGDPTVYKIGTLYDYGIEAGL